MPIIDKALRIGEGKKFKAFEKSVERINDFEAELELESDEELRERYEALRERALDGRVARRPAATSASRSPARPPSARSASATSTSS